MPYYSVLLEGSGLGAPDPFEPTGVTGFFTTRAVWAISSDSASTKAIEMVMSDWAKEPYSSQPNAHRLQVVVNDVAELPFIRGLLHANKGYAFFAGE